jgi:MoxR-like ATPase
MTQFGEFSRTTEPDPMGKLIVNGEPSGEGLGYNLDAALFAAVDVALWLGRPLLVTGEPGAGKTTLGYAVARRLGIERAYLFVTKSTSEARDLFYRYDALGRFRDAQAQVPTDAADYLAYQALGAAILDAHDPATITQLSVGRSHGWAPPKDPCRSLVVIDEIDKASRDFANDILVEIEKLQFDVPELTTTTDAVRRVPRSPAFPDPKLRPVVVVTSNAERPLPDAFLRRCVYVEARFPDDERLLAILHSILERRLGPDWNSPSGGGGGGGGTVSDLINQLVDKVKRFRADPAVTRPPGLAEVIDAAMVLAAPPVGGGRWDMVKAALAKTREDRKLWVDRFDSGGSAAG